MRKTKTRKQEMRDLKRQVSSRIRRIEKAEERLLYGNPSPVKRKTRKAPKSLSPQGANVRHEDRDLGADARQDD
ncbi:hypothetical protein ES708_27945 [subsurface metagenome]